MHIHIYIMYVLIYGWIGWMEMLYSPGKPPICSSINVPPPPLSLYRRDAERRLVPVNIYHAWSQFLTDLSEQHTNSLLNLARLARLA